MPTDSRTQDEQELEDQNSVESENEQEENAENTGNNGRITNTAQLLQQLSPLVSSFSNRPQVRSLSSQAHSYLRYFLFIEFLYIYVLDHSLLFFFLRLLSYLILVIMRGNRKKNAIAYWSSVTLIMLSYHFLEVFLIPSIYFEYDVVLKVYGPSSYNWLKASKSISDYRFWTEKLFLISERILCDGLVWILGYLSIFIAWKRDSLKYLRESDNDSSTHLDSEDNNETQGHSEEDIQIVSHSNIIEATSSNQQNLVHRRRSVGEHTQSRSYNQNQSEVIEQREESERRNLLSRNGSNDEDLFDSM